MNVQPTKWTKNTPKLMLSRYRGKCAECGKGINRGRPIVWSKMGGARHPECAGVEVPAEWETKDYLAKVAAVAPAVAPAVVPVLLTARPLAGELVAAVVGPPVVALVADEPADLAPDEAWWDLIAADEPAELAL